MIYCSIFLHNHFIIQVIPREKPFSFRQKVTNFNVEKRKELNWRNSTWCQWWGCAGRRRENKHHQRAHVGYPSGRLWGSHHCKEGPRPEFCTARGKWKWWINTHKQHKTHRRCDLVICYYYVNNTASMIQDETIQYGNACCFLVVSCLRKLER